MEKELYTTVFGKYEKEIEKIKGSRFIGRLIGVIDRDDAELRLAAIRKKYYDATHNCFAYTAGLEDNKIVRSSDDGEPSGTAGRPIATVLEGSGLSNALLVVTRYYGGTNLGTGGLIKAYTEAAQGVIASARVEKVEFTGSVRFSYAYDSTSLVMSLIAAYEGSVVAENFGDSANVTVSMNRGFTENFIRDLFERSNGKIKAEKC